MVSWFPTLTSCSASACLYEACLSGNGLGLHHHGGRRRVEPSHCWGHRLQSRERHQVEWVWDDCVPDGRQCIRAGPMERRNRTSVCVYVCASTRDAFIKLTPHQTGRFIILDRRLNYQPCNAIERKSNRHTMLPYALFIAWQGFSASYLCWRLASPDGLPRP